MTVGEFAEACAMYCLVLAASETSGGRTEQRNAAVGGVSLSAHRFHRGRDVVYDGAPPEDLRIEVGRRLGLRVIVEDDHDHLQPLDWRAG